MKLIVTVVQDQDAPHLLEKLLSGGYRATRLSSTGGFLRQGNTTLLVGAKDEKVEEAVSYTHLDVYKRQVYTGGTVGGLGAGCVCLRSDGAARFGQPACAGGRH